VSSQVITQSSGFATSAHTAGAVPTILPLAKLLGGRDSELRAALIASYVLGLATMRHGLESPSLEGPARRKAAAIVAKAIQSCVGKNGE
jgi:hypothetical protein